MVLYDGSASPTYLNGAAAEAKGIEAGVTTTLGSGVRASASYTYLEAEATDDGGMPSATFADGQRLIRRPSHSAQLALNARLLDRTVLGGAITYVGPRDDVDFNQFPSQRVRLPAYAVVDLAAEVEILRPRFARTGVSALVRVENLFNQRYDQVVGFGGRRRGIFGGARFRF